MPEQPGDPVRVTLVDAPACHLCVEAQNELAALATRYPVEVTALSSTSPAGAELMRRHRAAMSPLVLVDGEFFSNGRLPRRKLLRLLERQSGTTTTGAAG